MEEDDCEYKTILSPCQRVSQDAVNGYGRFVGKPESAGINHAVKHLLTSVVREICMLRSVGAGARATASGHPVGSQRWLSLPRSTTVSLSWYKNIRIDAARSTGFWLPDVCSASSPGLTNLTRPSHQFRRHQPSGLMPLKISSVNIVSRSSSRPVSHVSDKRFLSCSSDSVMMSCTNFRTWKGASVTFPRASTV